MASSKFLSAGGASPIPENVWRGLEETRSRASAAWGLSQIEGRLVEISGHRAAATLTVAFGLVLEAQKKEEPVAWVTLKQSTFFPPDVADSGIDLARLVVVRVEESMSAARAVVELARSGGFGLVVMDLGPEAIQEKADRAKRRRFRKKLSTPLITKISGLAQKHATAVAVLTDKSERESSLSSLVSLRAEARRDKDAPTKVEVAVLKDKHRGPGRLHHEVCRAPAGLR